MTPEEHILTIASDCGIAPSSAVFAKSLESKTYFVPIIFNREGDRQIPSGRDLSVLRKRAAESGYVLEFLLTNSESRTLEEGLRASLINSFPHVVRNVFLSMGGGAPEVWIDGKGEIGAGDLAEMNEHAKTFFFLFSITSFRINLPEAQNLSSNGEILSIVRLLAPATCEAVQLALLNEGYDVPSLDWVNRRFDSLRKSGWLVRRSDGSYILTALALQKLGTTKNRRSPDVSRFLALARRGK